MVELLADGLHLDSILFKLKYFFVKFVGRYNIKNNQWEETSEELLQIYRVYQVQYKHMRDQR